MKPTHEQWILPFAIQLIPAGLMFVFLFAIRESPRWLMSKGRRDEGVRNLCWIRNLDSSDLYMMEEITAIDAAIEHQRTTEGLGFWQPFRGLFTERKVLYRVFLGSSLFLWQNASGINAINVCHFFRALIVKTQY